ncbi:Helicase C-terminal [Penicillium bovifimosum]|uniref:Helicase C-terminal n=1 Tax=Penicillium bovifimosum TaxID=126998 RepID=A0A9W9KY26_9EURO|nr:Helicase C-terminal [Penicillium bovifimosum]KAJ5124868.1 Helicase C-terminal [Penicillium bovifimosum]
MISYVHLISRRTSVPTSTSVAACAISQKHLYMDSRDFASIQKMPPGHCPPCAPSLSSSDAEVEKSEDWVAVVQWSVKEESGSEEPVDKTERTTVPVIAHTHAPPVLTHRHLDHNSTHGALAPKHEHRSEFDPNLDTPRGLHATNGFTKPEAEYSAPVPRAPLRKPFPPGVDLEQVNRAAAEIDQAEKSDVESPGFNAEQQRYQEKSHKRSVESSRAEEVRRKVQSEITYLQMTPKSFERQALLGTDRFRGHHEGAVMAEVQQKEVQDEKERKKDMQRKRRCEEVLWGRA